MRKKKTAFIVCVVLILSLLMGTVSTANAADADYAYVRVKLSVGAPGALSFIISGNYSMNGTPIAAGNYFVSTDGATVYLYDGVSALVFSGASVALTPNATTPDNNIKITYGPKNGITYLGGMTFGIEGAGVSAVNRVYLEDYLYGVVPHEMSDYYPIEALKSQAIFARTYVVRYINPTGAYDVVDTSQNQVYLGYNPTLYPKSIQAVDATAGKVMMSGIDFAQGFFSASNGGYTEIPQHVWTSTAPLLPYHVIQPDPYDTANTGSLQEVLKFPAVFNETERITYQDSAGHSYTSANAEKYMETAALPALAAQGYMTDLNEIKIVGFGGFTPKTYEAKHDVKDYYGNDICVDYEQADVTMTVNALRYVASDGVSPMAGDVNFDGMVSVSDYTLVRLHILGIKSLPMMSSKPADVNADNVINIQDYTAIRLDILGLSDIPNGIASRENVTVSFTIQLDEFDTQGGAYTSFDETALRLFVVEQTASGWNLYHRRNGHGIGLSQRGAQERANQGQTCEQILAFYYPNTTLSTLSLVR